MKHCVRRFLFALLLATAVLFTGCAHNKLTDSWINPEYRGKLKGPVFIMGVFTDPIAHKIFEDSFVDEFGKIGIKAIPSYAYNLGTGQVNEDNTLHQTLRNAGARELLIIHLTNENSSSYQFPEKHYAWAGEVNWQSGYGYYSTIYADVWDETEVDKTVDLMEATLLDAESGARIWSARMRSVNLNKFVRTNDEQLEERFLKDMKPLFYKVRD